MKARRPIWKQVGKLIICGFLLVWIFHAIFMDQARLAWHGHGQGESWRQLSHAEQWRLAWKVGPSYLWTTLSSVRPEALALSLVLMGSTLLFGLWRWRVVLEVQGIHLSVSRTAVIALVAHFFNSFLLGSTGGDLLKAYYAARETHHKKTEAVTTVVVDRLIGLASMLLFAVAMMTPNAGLLVRHRPLAAVSGLVGAMLVVCATVVVLSFWGGLSRWLPRSRQWLRHLPKGDLIERSLESCRRFGQRRYFLMQTVGISMVLNLACVCQVWSLAWGMGLRVPLLVLFWVVPMIICLAAIPITPSGLGVRENLYVWTLATPSLHVNATQALSLSLLAYAGSLFWSLVGGVVYASMRERHHLKEVAAAEVASGPL